MTNIDQANEAIVREDLKKVILDAITQNLGSDGINDFIETTLDEMTTDDLWTTAAGYDLL